MPGSELVTLSEKRDVKIRDVLNVNLRQVINFMSKNTRSMLNGGANTAKE